MKKLHPISITALGIFFVGLLLVLRNPTVVGAFAGAYSYDDLSFIGVSLILLSVSLFIMSWGLERKMMQLKWLKQRRFLQERRQKLLAEKTQFSLSDAIKDDRLKELSDEALHDQYVKRDIEHLKEQLRNGNENPGIGTENLGSRTGIVYFRGRNGGRLYCQKVGSDYRVVAESGKDNQEQVIRKLLELYATKT